MTGGCLLYYITDRTSFPGDEAARRRRLLDKIAEAARCGVDYIQLREKDLAVRELESLAREAVARIQLETKKGKCETRFLINCRTDIALSVGADGVHLRSDDISVGQVRELLQRHHRNSSETGNFVVTVSCHSESEVATAAKEGADLAVFAPVFEKKDTPSTAPTGLDALRQACRHDVPVVALGGITPENARNCLDAGAAGIAAIRLFQENDIVRIVATLR